MFLSTFAHVLWNNSVFADKFNFELLIPLILGFHFAHIWTLFMPSHGHAALNASQYLNKQKILTLL
jgi:hypothetical protein